MVASPSSTHIDVAEEALSTGSSVLIEKPLSPSLTEAARLQTLVEAAAESATVVMMGHVLLFNSEYEQLRLEASRQGKIRCAYLDF